MGSQSEHLGSSPHPNQTNTQEGLRAGRAGQRTGWTGAEDPPAGGQGQPAPSKVTWMAVQPTHVPREASTGGGQSGIWFYEWEPGWVAQEENRGQVPWPLTFKDHHACLGTDPLDPGWPGQVVAVRVTAGPALVGARVLCGEPVHRQCAGRMLAVGGMDVDSVQPGAIPELGAAVVGVVPFKPPLDLRDGAAHSLTVQHHAAPRPLLLGQRRLEEAS